MVKLILDIYDFLSKRKVWVWIFFIIIITLFVFSSLSLNYKEDIADFLPVTKETKKYTSVYNNLGGQNKIAILFSCKDTSIIKEDNIDSITIAMDYFATVFNESSLANKIDDLIIQVDENEIFSVIDFFNFNYPYYLTKADYLRIDSLLSQPNYIENQLENNKQLLMLPTAGVIARNLKYDPLHLFTPIIQRLQSVKVEEEYNIVNGYLFNKENSKGIAFFTSPYGVSESKQNDLLVKMLDSVILKVNQQYQNINISAVGAPIIAVTNASQIKSDSIVAIIIALVLILFLLIYSFRRLDDLLWIVVSILFGWLFALALISLFMDGISIIVIGIGSIIMGIAVNYPLHFLDHIKHQLDKRIALKEIVSPLLIGNITTVSAFLCLVALDAQAMKSLGLFGALTLIGTIIFVLIFLPVLVKSRKASTTYLNLSFETNYNFSKKIKSIIFTIFLIITIILGYFSFKISFDSNIQNINYMTDQQRLDLNQLSNSIQAKKGFTTLYAVSQNKDIDLALLENEKMLSKIHSHNYKCKILGINGYIPSKSKQKEAVEIWNNFWHKYPDIIEKLKQGCKKLGFSQKAFTQFEDIISKEYKINDIDHFKPLYNLFFNNYVQNVDSVYRVINFVTIPTSDLLEIKEEINDANNDDYFAFDSKDVSNQLVTILSDSFNYIGFVCGFVVFIFLWLSFGRLELSLLSFLPLTVSWFWILGIMYLSDIQFNIVNIILATLIFGQGDDYTIFITEGLMYEYAYGKKTLKSYKNSIALSALIMLIGIGALIFAKHPAMKSLALVSIIGMITVLVMTYYLPPLVYKWIVTKNGKVRQVPLTIKRIVYSLYSFIAFLLCIYLLMYPAMFFYFYVGKVTERRKIKYHKMLMNLSKFVINRVPGVKFNLINRYNEKFEKPALIIANHQSHLDLMCILMLSPKIIILTNDWVWNNPFYGQIIKKAEFYPVSNGVEDNLDKLKELIDRGYSVVVFPEGTRSEDCSILRFHKGAFYLAQYLKIDILPLIIHGAGEVLPKKDFMLREGAIKLFIDKRIGVENFVDRDCRELTMSMRRFYKEEYGKILKEYAKADYYLPFVKYKYMYKGKNIENRSKKVLNNIAIFTNQIDKKKEDTKSVGIINSGQGEFAWLYALVHKDVEVYAFEKDEDLHLISANTSDIPMNLHFIKVDTYENVLADNYDELIYL